MSYEEDYQIDADYYNENMDDLGLTKNNSYTILKEDQLLLSRDSFINEAMNYICLGRDEVILVMIYYNWNLDKMRDSWFDDAEGISIKCGIQMSEADKKSLNIKGIKGNNKECLVCFSPKDNSFGALSCGHFFCADCWNEYLSVKTDDVLTSLGSLCPQQGCTLIVPESFFYKYLTDKAQRDKFTKSVIRNYTGQNSDIKTCPGASCNVSIRCDSHSAKEITCVCGTVFCFKCWKESHRPCNCDIVAFWEIRSKSDTDNDKWMKANTKTCPHCKQRIEKSQGCNYMLCDKNAGGCGKAFCYVCEVDWAKHSQDHFNCNMYTPQIKEKESEAARLKAELERYKFYFDRYINYAQAVKFAEKLSSKLKTIVDSIVNIKMMPLSELEFLYEALRTVISSKRTLKYTYIFGYFLKDGNDKKLFEYSQSYLERNSDNLHQLIEQDQLINIVSEENYELFNKRFIDFKNRVVNLCFATTKYQTNLLNEIENSMLHLLDEKLF